MRKAIDVKVNIKPVYSNMVHTDIWEGPCRVGPPELLDPAYERRAGLEQFSLLKKRLEENLDLRFCRVMEPTYMEWDESFVIPEREMDKLKADADEVEVYLLNYRVPGIERFGKFVSMIDNGPTPLDVMGFYQAIGVDGFFAGSYEEYNHQTFLRYVRKAVVHTKWLILSATEQITETGNCCITDLYSLYQKYGIRNNRRPMQMVFDQMDQMELTEDMKQQAAELLAKTNEKTVMGLERVSGDVKFREAVLRLMEKFDCNGFTISCKALYASRQPWKHKITPCLCHSMNKDEGIPSACEEDINALLTMTIFTYLAQKAIYMGNPVMLRGHEHTCASLGIPTAQEDQHRLCEQTLLEIHHAVPARKMAGFDQQDLPYHLSPFTMEGFGTRFQIDMNREAPCKTVTIARFNRTGDSVIVAKAQIVGTRFGDSFCSPFNCFVLDGDVSGFRHRLVDGCYGAHLCMAYGDYVPQWQELGRLMGFRVEYCHG